MGPVSDRHPVRDGKTQCETKKQPRTGNRQASLAKPALAKSWVAKQMIELSINAASPKPRGQWGPSCLLTPFRELGQNDHDKLRKLPNYVARVLTFPLAVPPDTPMRKGCRIMLVFTSRSLRCVSLSPAILAVCRLRCFAGISLWRSSSQNTNVTLMHAFFIYVNLISCISQHSVIVTSCLLSTWSFVNK